MDGFECEEEPEENDTEERTEDQYARILELTRRNREQLPQMKSCYPLETMVSFSLLFSSIISPFSIDFSSKLVPILLHFYLLSTFHLHTGCRAR